MRQASVLASLLLACAAHAALADAGGPAPSPARPEPPVRVPENVAAFFSGDWAGEGAFASGKPIAADVSFHLELDGQWLQYRHADRAPMTYKALGMWGVERSTHKLVMTLNDNGGSARSFSSDGWSGDAVTFVRTVSGEPPREERFVFTRLSADSFRMAYEVHAGQQPWRLVDQLVFQRVR